MELDESQPAEIVIPIKNYRIDLPELPGQYENARRKKRAKNKKVKMKNKKL